MIQRIQTIFLLLVIFISSSLFFLPLCEKTDETRVAMLFLQKSTHLCPEGEVMVSRPEQLIANILVIILTLIAVFRYKQRPLQIKLVNIVWFVVSALAILVFYNGGNLAGEGHTIYLAGSYLIVLQLLLLKLATRAIKKDELLVRSADRIR